MLHVAKERLSRLRRQSMDVWNWGDALSLTTVTSAARSVYYRRSTPGVPVAGSVKFACLPSSMSSGMRHNRVLEI